MQSSDRNSILRYAHFLSLRTSQQPFNISLTILMSYTAQPLIRSIINDRFCVLVNTYRSIFYGPFFTLIRYFRSCEALVLEQRSTKIGSEQKNFGQSSNHVFLQIA